MAKSKKVQKKSISKWIFLIIAAMLLVFFRLPNMAVLKYTNPKMTSFMAIYEDKRDSDSSLPMISETYVPYEKISTNLKRAVLISEDDLFFSHSGFNWIELKKAIKKDLKTKSFKRGASTITQQLVKNLYLSPSKNPFRKLKEWLLTFQMENTLDKKRIFELYLNYAEWGNGIYGAEAASQYYFKKPASNLSPREAAFLAAILPNPVVYGSGKKKRTVDWRMNRILSRLNTGNVVDSDSN